MPIQTNRNAAYGPPLVNQKYRPLENIKYVADDNAYYSALLNNRWNLVNALNILPQPLKLAVPDWTAIIMAENRPGQKPPLVVISSNRSNWILQGITAAKNQLTFLPNSPAAFNNASDLRALEANVGQDVSPPIYCPTRIGAAVPRNVYIVVHITEYLTYKNTLAGTDITVVGWVFDLPVPRPAQERMAGFGASRYAAIEFCKELRTQAAARAPRGIAPWNYAWLFDDNVVSLSPFPGYAAAEAAMKPATVCTGFHGGTVAETFLNNRKWARNEIALHRGKQTPALPKNVPPGIVQQASLWNIAYLTTNFLNFGPIYISSAEDLSFTNYFNHEPIPYQYYTGIGIRKELASLDGGAPAQKVNTARDGYAAWFSAEESQGIAAVLPPPVQVNPEVPGDGGVQTIANFVDNYVLPNSTMREAADNTNVQNNAKCQAVEQITSGALEKGYISKAAKNITFKINGAAAQPVIRVNLP